MGHAPAARFEETASVVTTLLATLLWASTAEHQLSVHATVGVGLDTRLGSFGSAPMAGGLGYRLRWSRFEVGGGVSGVVVLPIDGGTRDHPQEALQAWVSGAYRFALSDSVSLPLRLRLGAHGFFNQGAPPFSADPGVAALIGFGPSLLFDLTDHLALEVPIFDLTYVQSVEYYAIWAGTGVELRFRL